MSRDFDDEDRSYERREAEYDARERRRKSGCACGLDGYPGQCPGRDACPYNDEHATDEEDDDQGQ